MSNKTYPEWQAKIRKLQDEEAQRLMDKATRRAKDLAHRLHTILTAGGLDVPTVGTSAWNFKTCFYGDGTPYVLFWLNHEGYIFAIDDTVKEYVTVGKGERRVVIRTFHDSDVYAIARALDALDRLTAAQGVEVGAAD